MIKNSFCAAPERKSSNASPLRQLGRSDPLIPEVMLPGCHTRLDVVGEAAGMDEATTIIIATTTKKTVLRKPTKKSGKEEGKK